MDEKYEARLEAGRGKDRSGRVHQVPLLSVVVGVAIVIFVITISVLALVNQQQEGHRLEVGRRRVVHHSEPHFEQSLLLARLGRGSAVLEAPETGLSDIFISVKTSRKFHETRLGVVLGTWWQQARDSTYFFTDEVDPATSLLLGPHLVATSCPSDHSRQALCCKMQAELDMFLKSDKSWFCHFDDDQYVNVAALEAKLRQFDQSKDWYLGKPSIAKPLDILDRDSQESQKRISFWFATGGAGFCLSRPLTERMRHLSAGGRFTELGDKMRLPDDVTMGFLVESLAGVAMTRVDQFHSHLEPLRLVTDLHNQISFSYSSYGEKGERNVVEVEGFSEERDPTRFLSLHCYLNPHMGGCDAVRR